ncbi:MAG: helix-turn-helix domain-containing protein [Actinomycetota bacterium]|nr:helix-turn-helix domain-containing protein [Actinomycetota bacterium]
MTTETGGAEVERLLSLNEVTEILGVSRRTVKSLVHEGDLTSVKIRRRRLVRPRDLRVYIDALDNK